jgi:hypothetical protein
MPTRTVYTTAPNFEDPRISNLPKWAQELISAGELATRNVTYWREKTDEARQAMDQLKAEHAREKGVDEYDTWTTVHTEGDEEIRTGLGRGVPVHFGDATDVCETYSVTYRNGGLDIRTPQSSGLILKTADLASMVELRVEVP